MWIRIAPVAVIAFALACGRPSPDSGLLGSSMLELDGSGQVDCADLEHVLSCMHHPHDTACLSSDLNHDGVVDAHDAELAHDSLAALGHSCQPPSQHLGAGSHHTAGHDGGH